ncbi:MAG: type II toxin-antitoxin system VapC family toxin [Actinobacteria bacterium]|nr:type II toxin-antitoxin system VapC family toxin [Actinomycetota bacterium]
MATAEPESLLLDTHALLWWQASSDLLSPRARRLIDAAPRLFVSPISLSEIATMVGQSTVALDRPTQMWVHDLLADGIVATAELTPTIAVAAALLDEFTGDIADRIIYATAVHHQLALVTKDPNLTEYALAQGDTTIEW